MSAQLLNLCTLLSVIAIYFNYFYRLLSVHFLIIFILNCRKLNGTSSSLGKRPPSASSQQAIKRRRSRSRSPPKSSRSKYPPQQRHNNGHSMDSDKSLSASLASSAAAGMQQQLYPNPLLPLLNADNKALPSNGFQSSAADLWALGQQRGVDNQQQQRDRLLAHLNPALAMAINERERNEMKERAALQMLERAKVSNNICTTNIPSLNGYHHTNTLASLGSIPGLGGPPPLVPTTQTNLHSTHSQPNSTSTEGYLR